MFVRFVVLALFVSMSARAQSGSGFQGEGRTVVIRADRAAVVHEVVIGPNLSTHLIFNTPVKLLALERRASFRRVSVAEDAILLLTARDVALGTRLRMTVRLLDSVAPTSVDFVLVVGPPTQAERQVEVFGPRALEPCQEARGEHEEALRCRESLAELTRACAGSDGQTRLTDLLTSGFMDEEGILTLPLQKLLRPQKQLFKLKSATSLRANRSHQDGTESGRVRVAVELWMKSQDPRPWLASGAELVNGEGMRHGLSVWQPGPFVMGQRYQRLVVEAELEAAEARGTFSLELWEEGGTRRVSFGGVSFP